MPVRFNKGGDAHEREDYTFRTGDYGSRDFARLRRFGGEDPEDSRTMSLVSSPLQVPLVGKRRSVSPSYRQSPAPQQLSFEADEDLDEEIRSVQRQNRRHSVESNRRRYDHRNYDDYDDEILEPLVPTYQPRAGRSSVRSHQPRYESPTSRYTPRRQKPQLVEQYEEEFDEEPPRYQQQQYRDFLQQQQREREDEQRQAVRRKPKHQEEEENGGYRWRKRSTQDHAPNDIGYTVPPIRKRADPQQQEEEEDYKTVAGYIAKRKQFAVEDDDDMHYYRNPNYQYRMLGGGERPMISNRDVEESIARTTLDRAPMFDMKLRSHVVWEKMNVKFTCTVRGHPTPRVTWYKDMVPLEPSLHNPGKYKISNQFGLHTLEICRTSIEDSGTYRVSMQNRKGEISSYATLLVRRYDGGKMGVVDMKSGYNLKKPTDYPDVEGLNVPDMRPHVGDIKVEEFDELPDTEAGRHFKSQLENLDFDVNKLIKEAKLDKEISGVDGAEASGTKPATLSDQAANIVDDIMLAVREPGGSSVTLDGTTSTSEISATVGSDKKKYDVISTEVIKSGSDDVTDDEQQSSKNRFKTAIEVTVTNEARRDSMDVIEKVLDIDQATTGDKA